MSEAASVSLPGHVGAEPLHRRERWCIAAFFALVVVFAVPVELRTAFMERRMGDLGVFLRAAWAVRAEVDPYDITDDNGFHYCYPPLLAILAMPVADPPANADSTGMLPFAVSVAVWYVVNVIALFLAVHWLAGALDDAPAGSRRWWALRQWPVYAVLIPLGHTLMRGQANFLVLVLLCGSLALSRKGRSFLAGMCLSWAACLKIFPAFLLIYPVWRRDGRCLAGAAVGFVLGLVAVPVLVLGPERAWNYNVRLNEVLIKPGLGVGNDQSRAKELTNVTATDSQSLLGILHNTLYPEVATRPVQASPAERLATYVGGGLMTLLTLLAAGWRRSDDRIAPVLLLGLLILDMLFLCPICHLHYFVFALPLTAGLLVARWETNGGTLAPGRGLMVLFVVGTVAQLLPHLPAFFVLRDLGSAAYAALALWVVGVVALWKRTRRSLPAVRPQPARAAA